MSPLLAPQELFLSAVRGRRMVCAADRGADPVDLDAVSGLLRLGKVVLHLQTEPDLRTAAEGLGQPYGNTSPAIDEVVEGLALHAKASSGLGNSEAQGFNALLPDDPLRLVQARTAIGYP